MKYEIKAIGYWSVIKISFILNLVIGFIFGIFYALFMGAILSIAEQFGGMPSMPAETFDTLSTGAMIIIFPIMFSLMGAFFNTILALIITFVYNIIARLMGGLEFELSEIRVQPVSYAPSQPQYYQPQSQPPPAPPKPSPPASTPPPAESQPEPPSRPSPPPPVQPLPPDVVPPGRDEEDKDNQLL